MRQAFWRHNICYGEFLQKLYLRDYKLRFCQLSQGFEMVKMYIVFENFQQRGKFVDIRKKSHVIQCTAIQEVDKNEKMYQLQ